MAKIGQKFLLPEIGCLFFEWLDVGTTSKTSISSSSKLSLSDIDKHGLGNFLGGTIRTH